MEHEGDSDTSCNWSTRKNPQRLGKGTGRLRNQKTSGDHPEYTIIKIDQNTEKSPGDLRRLTVTQTCVKNHLLILLWKTLKEVKEYENYITNMKIPFADY